MKTFVSFGRPKGLGGIFRVEKLAEECKILWELEGSQCDPSLIWDLLLLQPHGEPGLLTTQPEKTNIFFVTKDRRCRTVVNARWIDGWYLDASPNVAVCPKGREWEEGNQVIADILPRQPLK
ncbi:MAG: hypothetical protein FJY91_03205 [Candidatus Harrisonbacteria bacterium]|nr:hypothetical protein [Candidatus Harrisonbacteria bacterium]